eukprot:CAMPEP_0205932306 /NCGR_PEP_ID=MMETSP1325-20131115/29448_1 /ASSEMBLY_ACC=CAM_ASM_000708 /TAXON_ID=236786 /ORGANISM="Florenciella sp., Strain RCC1007" /LENGTH=45 /DNA_ID= /DNA_START= /DNA_END= /DNA_ORIENTATION=
MILDRMFMELNVRYRTFSRPKRPNNLGASVKYEISPLAAIEPNID